MNDLATPPSHASGRAWLVWALAALSFGYAFFQRVAPSVMVSDLMRAFDVGAAVLGNLSAVYLYAYAGLQVPVGLLLDRFGPRRMLTGAAGLGAAGSLLFASAQTLSVAYLGRLLVGIGAAVGFVGTLKLVAHWFPVNRYAFLAGMTMLVGMLGGVGGQAPLALSVEAVGWRETLLAAAVFAGGLATLTWLLVRDDPAGRAAASARQPAPGRSILLDIGHVLSRSQNWFIALYGGTMAGPMLAYAGLWGVPHLVQLHGLERAVAAGSASLMLIGWALGAPLGGWLSDRLGRRRIPMATAAGAALLGWLLLLYVPVPLVLTWVLLFVVGAVSGAMVICMAVARELAPPAVSGATTGFVNTANVGAGAVLQPIIGLVLDARWEGLIVEGARTYSLDAFGAALAILPACAALSLVSALLVRETYCRPAAT
ncbi:MAG: MFS transporter [Gammaproteobacteria bacterium]|nr:MFS transporter [Gammaproteobacteria bacterium]NIR82882.1 MFS transporter [Gammaproteobacteria bacterium]NIR89991.1 MFS transporter [Gammaproteobacteria bacterium]NIU04040.1 MFS transporter [Gammaproteobacteria bacterium]NIV51360.1 MFS transporter [Gammaproteobacteria bacterium]